MEKIRSISSKHPSIGAGAHTKTNTTPYTFKRSLSRSDAQDNVMVVMGASGNVSVNVTSIASWTKQPTQESLYGTNSCCFPAEL
ncbi:MAG: hypothetical protein IPO92_18580 [Saprospiraceae bacterium]|nr:hypothetical protein [Saprospiraceae bacterium]